MQTLQTRKALVVDIDGTLVNSKKEISPATKEAIFKMLEAGHVMIIASGRPAAGIKRFEEELKLDRYGGYLLSFNGAKVVRCSDGETIYEKTMSPEYAKKIYDFAKKNGTGILTYEGDVCISSLDPDEYIILETSVNRTQLKPVEDFPAYVTFPPHKFILTAEGSINEKLEKPLQELYGKELSIYRSEPFFLEVMAPGVDKGQALGHILDTIGVLRENTICCGDGFNDISMIRYAGVGVAMANAQQPVLECADYITASNDEDGIAQVIYKFILTDGSSD